MNRVFWTVRRSAHYLHLDTWQVYYLIAMGSIEAIKVAGAWRVIPEGVIEYDKRHIARENREPRCNLNRGRSSTLLLGYTPDYLPHDLPKRTGRVQGQRGNVVHSSFRNQNVLQQKNKSITQLEFIF